MNIVVCIKQVPDTAEVRIDPETNTLIREGVASILNPFDTYALEEALQIREKLGGTVTAVTMGPPQAEAILREAVSMGVDRTLLISDRAFAGADTLATSYTLAKAIEKIGQVDLILCGKQAIDGDTAQVGPGIAVHLGIPQIIFVRKIREISEEKLVAERMIESGAEVVESSLPALVSVVKDINTPRLPSLRGRMAAKNAEIPVWTAADLAVEEARLGLKGSPTWVHKIFSPPAKTGGKVFTGEAADIVDAFMKEVRENQLFS
ncbi:electron transfer flavoprotein subunit beta/FixA family protein [bacterium]|nr:electron transfer flavoprotein subunit beta/FixA family protein [bacterium]